MVRDSNRASDWFSSNDHSVADASARPGHRPPSPPPFHHPPRNRDAGKAHHRPLPASIRAQPATLAGRAICSRCGGDCQYQNRRHSGGVRFAPTLSPASQVRRCALAHKRDLSRRIGEARNARIMSASRVGVDLLHGPNPQSVRRLVERGPFAKEEIAPGRQGLNQTVSSPVISAHVAF